MTNNQGKGWHGDPQGHQQAGQKAANTAEERYGEDFHEKVGSLGGQAAQERGTAHKLTKEERSKGGKMSGGKGGKAHEVSEEEEFDGDLFE